MEACGTSGMKAALNGVLNFSVLDGWWLEGHDFLPSSGFSIGPNVESFNTLDSSIISDTDHEDASDLSQEVFLRVFQGLPRFSLRSKFTTWLFQVTKNRVLDELRASERRPRAVVDLDEIPPLEVLDAPFERLEAIDAVWRAVEQLSVDLKMALLLRDVVGLSYSEIADSLEVTLATVKWRIWKAREDVQLSLAREGIEIFEERDVADVEISVPVLAPPAVPAA